MIAASAFAKPFGPLNRPEVLVFAAVFLAAYLPFLPFAPWLQTYMLPWRAELTAAVFGAAGLVWTYRRGRFGEFLADLPRNECWTIIVPISAFTLWSFASIGWANSAISVLHHSLAWGVYLAFYLVLRAQFSGRTHSRRAALVSSVFVLVLCAPPVVTYYGLLVSGGGTSIALAYSKWTEVINALLPLIVVLALSPRRRVSMFALAIVALIWFFDIATLRRTAIAIFPLAVLSIGAVVCLFGQFRRYRPRLKYLIGILAVVPVLAYSASFAGHVDNPATARMGDWTVSEASGIARKHLARIAIEMFLSRPLTGVGADNFGFEFRRFNLDYATAHPDDRSLEAAEIGVPERAHNEYVQILAELGVVGSALMLWMLLGLAYLVVAKWREPGGLPMYAIAALVGVAAFLASSVASSYSFRLSQNGIIFFFLLSMAVAGLTVRPKAGKDKEPTLRRASWLAKPVLGLGLAACAGLIFLSTWRAAGAFYAHRATVRESFDDAVSDFELSQRIDPENAASHLATGAFLLGHDRAVDAAVHFRKAIDLGRALPADFSYLATAHIMAGDPASARDVLAEAVRNYPFSIFLRTRYAVVLAETGEGEKADRQFAIAAERNESHARGWRNLITVGADKAGRIAYQQHLPPLMELQPTPAVYAMVAERELRFPEERSVIPF